MLGDTGMCGAMMVTGQAPTPEHRFQWTSLLNDANGTLDAPPPGTCLVTSLPPSSSAPADTIGKAHRQAVGYNLAARL